MNKTTERLEHNQVAAMTAAIIQEQEEMQERQELREEQQNYIQHQQQLQLHQQRKQLKQQTNQSISHQLLLLLQEEEQSQLQTQQQVKELLLLEKQQQIQQLHFNQQAQVRTNQQKIVSSRKHGFTEIDQRPETIHRIHQFKRLQKQKQNDYKRYKSTTTSSSNKSTTTKVDGSPNTQRSSTKISKEKQMAFSSPSKKQSSPTMEEENYHYKWRQPIIKNEKYSFAVAFDVEEIVSKAVSLLVAELKSGIWTHEDSNGDDDDNGSSRNGSNIDKDQNDENIGNGEHESMLFLMEMNKLNTISVVLEQFAMDMIVPSIIASGVGEVKCISADPAHVMKFRKQRDDRVFVSVLLNLREVMILNAEKFFSIKSNIIDDCNDDDDTFRAYLLATTLILSAIQRLEPESVRESLLGQFKDAAQKYDIAHEEFTSCLQRADACSLGVTPTGRELPREENIAWRVSHNFTRNSHPLIQKQQLIDGFKPPSPNACYVSVVDKVASSSLVRQSPRRKCKIENESYVLKKHRAFMNRCMKAHNIEK